ncbi:hypothetical protein [Bradyrhizobium sp.]|uniref:hypothetical protein n=1 Tax=Bradyrhizobium sp. TaxID=376 RepID=UPI0023A76026|nr:hypothetical protein [Bradyrhizobium sp.]MDE2376502.1 hypothetical protein [Bradyrhizobium sp.]
MSELAKLYESAPSALDPATQLADANRRGLDFVSGAQRLVLEEMVFAANELADRTQTEAHLFAEFLSKLAGSHSVRDWGTMYRECSQHQLDFVRRDCDRLFKHGARMLEAAFSLVNRPG